MIIETINNVSRKKIPDKVLQDKIFHRQNVTGHIVTLKKWNRKNGTQEKIEHGQNITRNNVTLKKCYRKKLKIFPTI